MKTKVYRGNFNFKGYIFNFMATTGDGNSLCWKSGGKNVCMVNVEKNYFGESCNIKPLAKNEIKRVKDFIKMCEKRYK